MNREKQDKTGPRDNTLARLVADALEAQSAKEDSATCPDGDLLAAYAEHALQADEVARWESHFADCNRCQKVLAVLTVSGEDPLTEQEIARLGKLVGEAALPAEPPAIVPKTAKPSKHWTRWQWLVPAFGVATAAVLWIALRPAAPRPELTAEKIAAPSPSQLQSQQGQAAQTNTPPLPTANAPTTPPKTEQPSLDREAAAPQKESPNRDDQASDAKKIVSAASALETNRTAVTTSPQATERALTAIVAGAAGVMPTPSATAASPLPIPPDVQRQEAAPAPPQPSAPSATDQLSAANNLKPSALATRNTMAALAKVSVPPAIFSAPDRSAEWRVGRAGSIERSSDQGKTWVPQPSGVSSDLLSGVAVSDKIAWIVGRANVILKTTDGEHWLSTTAPPRDVTGIQATDALHATAASADGAHFATADGGQTWTLQP